METIDKYLSSEELFCNDQVIEDIELKEKVTFHAQFHWLIFLRPLMWMGSGLFCYFMVQSSLGPTQQNMILFLVGSGCLSIALLLFFQAIIAQHSTKFKLFPGKVVAEWGLFRRKTLEHELSDTNSLVIEQCSLGKLFDAGSLKVDNENNSRIPFQNLVKSKILPNHDDLPLMIQMDSVKNYLSRNNGLHNTGQA